MRAIILLILFSSMSAGQAAEPSLGHMDRIQTLMALKTRAQVYKSRLFLAQKHRFNKLCEEQKKQGLFPEKCYEYLRFQESPKVQVKILDLICKRHTKFEKKLSIQQINRLIAHKSVSCACKSDLLLAKNIFLYKMNLSLDEGTGLSCER